MTPFRIEQIAIAPRDPAAARRLLNEMMAWHPQAAWTEDHVTAEGQVFGSPASNEANLSFVYALGTNDTKPLEFEILDYTRGANWLNWLESPPSLGSIISHIGMHCSAMELAGWRTFFAERGIFVAQEVLTTSHTNPAIKDSRHYQYVIFDTREVLGVDIKFIVRLDGPGANQGKAPNHD